MNAQTVDGGTDAWVCDFDWADTVLLGGYSWVSVVSRTVTRGVVSGRLRVCLGGYA